MKAIISRTSNGAWLRIINKDEDGVTKEDFSYQFDAYKHDGEQMHGLASMLWDILGSMGWDGDRHDEQRIQIRVVHGDKFSHADKREESECKICQESK
jgi:hypothetical protein